MMYDREALTEAFEQGSRPPFAFFWGHTPPVDLAPGAWTFSQWADCSFVIYGVRYATAEHWMMAEKARLFGDEASRIAVLDAKTPAIAKELGRGVSGFDDAVWLEHRVAIVRAGNLAKFSQNAGAKQALLATEGQVLVEATPRDNVWGIGLGRENVLAQDSRTWRGLNLLGFALMWVRDEGLPANG